MSSAVRAGWPAALGAVALLVAGCALEEAREAPPPSSPGAQPGGSVTVAVTAPGGIEPTFASSPSGLLIGSTICDTLVHIEPGTGDVKPGLAESWTITDEGTTITFKLRKDLRFHGTSDTLTSQDVVFSLARLADPTEGSYLAGLVEPISGWEAFRDPDDPAPRLDGVQAIDEHAVQLRLTTGAADAIRLFAHPATAPVSADAVEANPVVFGRSPVCVGPYQLAEPFEQNATEIVVERDPNYFAGAVAYTGGGHGYADEIVFRIYDDDEAVYEAWKEREVDVAWVPTGSFGDAMAEDADDLVLGVAPDVEYVGVPATVAEGSALEGFNQPAVRQALSLALDRGRIAEEVYEGARIAASGFVPPSATDESVHEECEATVPTQADVDGARELLSEAGVELEGRVAPFYYNDEFGHAELVAEIAAQWQEAFGLRIKPRPLAWDALLDRAVQGLGLDGLFRVSWSADSLSAETYLRPLVSETGTGPNLARFSTPAAERALFEIDNAESGDRSLAVLQLEEIICRELPAIPVVFGQSSWAVRSSEVGLARDDVIDMSGRLLLRELYVIGE